MVEIEPEFYLLTTPITVTLQTELGDDYQANFDDVPADVARCLADSFEEDDTLLSNIGARIILRAMLTRGTFLD